MKKIFIMFLIILTSSFMYAQEVEKFCVLDEIKCIDYEIGGIGNFPTGIYIDEVNYLMVTQDPWLDENVTINLINKKITKEKQPFPVGHSKKILKFGNNYWGIDYGGFECSINDERYEYIDGVGSGVCFILKKGNGYIVYYVDEGGYPCAVDTTGHIYNNEEAIAYLKKYDPEKYEQSKKKSAELELYNDFIRNRVLIWGETYYSTYDILTEFWKPEQYLYGRTDEQIQYDEQGNGYGANIRFEGINSNICINDINGKRIARILLQDSSDILSDPNVKNIYFTSAWFIGFGGNIYYYIAGEEYTEVFRIRRTWGEPDFYAMAINGYTDDSYGKYVNKVLPTLSKADLRLLRNTIFALYGVHFKSADLSKYFDKQVWYSDEGKTSGEIQLPEYRQKLVEMIQVFEKK